MPISEFLRKKEKEKEKENIKVPSSSSSTASPLQSPTTTSNITLSSSSRLPAPPSSSRPAPPPKDTDLSYADSSRRDTSAVAAAPPPPQFTIVRTTTTTEEVIQPPSFYSEEGNYNDDDDDDDDNNNKGSKNKGNGDRPGGLRSSRFRWSSYSSSRRSSKQSIHSDDGLKMKEKDKEVAGEDGPGMGLLDSGGSSSNNRQSKDERRLSDRLHLRSPRLRPRSRSRSSSTASSANLPAELTELELEDELRGKEDDDREAEWEKRATALGMARADATTSREGSRAGSVASLAGSVGDGSAKEANGPRMRRGSSVGDEKKDSEIQEAIQLHEEGRLEQSTALFGKLADPNGANNPLSQVLYGLALRHGWGCRPDAERALTYLSHAASNSADIESIALRAGMKKGGAAKGELVLAIFELGNCYRHAWGVPKKDPVAARHYYETAANLGDVDALNEIAWCYLEGFGCRKDKHKAAQYLRRAEEKGGKTVGNSWYVLKSVF